MDIHFFWDRWRLRFDYGPMVRCHLLVWLGPAYVSITNWADAAVVMALLITPWVALAAVL